MILGGSLGGVVSLGAGADTLQATAANAATVLGGTENDTFSFRRCCARLQPGGWIWCRQPYGDGLVAWFDDWGGESANGGSPIDGADYVSVGSASASVVYGNSGADTMVIGGSATATSLYGGVDNDLMSISGDLSAGEIIGGSGADTMIITGSLMGSAAVTLDSPIRPRKRTTASRSDSSVLELLTATWVTTPCGVRHGQSASLYGGEATTASVWRLLMRASLKAVAEQIRSCFAGSLKGGRSTAVPHRCIHDGSDLVSVEFGISAGAVYGNQGDDTLLVNAGGANKATIYGGSGNDSLTSTDRQLPRCIRGWS